jgi:hypothetical protein
MVFRNVGILPQHHTVSQPRTYRLECLWVQFCLVNPTDEIFPLLSVFPPEDGDPVSLRNAMDMTSTSDVGHYQRNALCYVNLLAARMSCCVQKYRLNRWWVSRLYWWGKWKYCWQHCADCILTPWQFDSYKCSFWYYVSCHSSYTG